MSEKKAAKCPDCGEPLEIYQGDNAHKKGTGYCANEGKRVPLKS